MLGQAEVHAFRDFPLPKFNRLVGEFFDVSAFQAHHMVVVIAPVKFENRVTAFEMMAFDQTCCLELREHPVNCRETDFLTLGEQKLVYFLGRQVPLGSLLFFQHFEYLDPRQSDF